MEEDTFYFQLTTIAALLVIVVILLVKINRTMQEPVIVVMYKPETLEKAESPISQPRAVKE